MQEVDSQNMDDSAGSTVFNDRLAEGQLFSTTSTFRTSMSQTLMLGLGLEFRVSVRIRNWAWGALCITVTVRSNVSEHQLSETFDHSTVDLALCRLT